MKGKMVVVSSMKYSLVLFLIIGLVITNGCKKKKEVEKETEKVFSNEIAAKGTSNKTVVNKGDKVTIEYVGKLEDGTVFDKTEGKPPIEFIVGNGQVIPGFEKAVEGMKLNEEKKVTIKVEDAYGKRDETLKRELSWASFPKDFKPEKGMVIRLQDQNGRTVMATILNSNEKGVNVDLNHPLAGKTLIFDMKIVGIE